MPQFKLSKSALNKAIFHFEVSWSSKEGWLAYNKFYRKPIVPLPKTTNSGVTIGLGFDCGHVTRQEIITVWKDFVTPSQLIALANTAGKTKINAVAALKTLEGLEIPIESALKVFYKYTLPKFCRETYKAYPAVIKLHPVEQSTFVGLVYNRGAGLDGPRRLEMKELVKAIEKDNDKEMGGIIRKMKRLWVGITGLLRRRDTEADLIELPDNPIPPEDLLIVNI